MGTAWVEVDEHGDVLHGLQQHRQVLGDVIVRDRVSDAFAFGLRYLAESRDGLGVVFHEVEFNLARATHSSEFLRFAQQHRPGSLCAVLVATGSGVAVDERDAVVLRRAARLAGERGGVAVDDGVLEHGRRLLVLVELARVAGRVQPPRSSDLGDQAMRAPGLSPAVRVTTTRRVAARERLATSHHSASSGDPCSPHVAGVDPRGLTEWLVT